MYFIKMFVGMNILNFECENEMNVGNKELFNFVLEFS